MMFGNRKKMRQIVICHVAFSLLAGCSYGSYLPAGDKQARMTGQETRKLADAPAVGTLPENAYSDLSYDYVTVRTGDSLSGLAQRFEIPMVALAALNHIQPPYLLFIDQQLKIPAFRQHKIVGGENLYAISKAYEVDMTELVHFNQLSPPYRLSVGNQLRIPLKGGQFVAGNGTGASTANGNIQVASLGGDGLMPLKRHRPLRESLGKLQSQPQSQPLSAPVKKATSAPTIKKQPQPSVPVKTARTSPPEPAKDLVAVQSRTPIPRKRFYETSEPPRRSKGPFAWPAKGSLISGFGVKKSGFRNDGVNIRVNAGTPVRAAENGVVSYVGNEMRSFGNLLLISHADGYVTAYGHTDELLVQKGERVRKGDVVGYAGSTGNVSSPQLHFEIRKKGKAVNPVALLASR